MFRPSRAPAGDFRSNPENPKPDFREPRQFIEDVMPKLKTHKGAAKRFKKTGTGKVKRSHAFMRHILTSKSTKKKRHLDIDTLVSKADEAKVKRMIPYD